MELKTLIPACVAFYLGEHEETPKLGEHDEAPERVARRARIARMLNRYVPRLDDKPALPEDTWSSGDTVWRDALTVSQRLMQSTRLLQRFNL
jgi:hypothetical protein